MLYSFFCCRGALFFVTEQEVSQIVNHLFSNTRFINFFRQFAQGVSHQLVQFYTVRKDCLLIYWGLLKVEYYIHDFNDHIIQNRTNQLGENKNDCVPREYGDLLNGLISFANYLHGLLFSFAKQFLDFVNKSFGFFDSLLKLFSLDQYFFLLVFKTLDVCIQIIERYFYGVKPSYGIISVLRKSLVLQSTDIDVGETGNISSKFNHFLFVLFSFLFIIIGHFHLLNCYLKLFVGAVNLNQLGVYVFSRRSYPFCWLCINVLNLCFIITIKGTLYHSFIIKIKF